MGQFGSSQVASNFDTARRYVRLCRKRPDGFVEFEFAIGDPALAVELMLPEMAFHDFCLANDVIVLDPVEQGGGDWRPQEPPPLGHPR